MKYSSKEYAHVLLETIDDERGEAVVKKFLSYVRTSGDFQKIPHILRDFRKLYNAKYGLRDVKVTLARPNGGLIQAVQEKLKLKHEPEVEIKKELLGGAVVSIDDEVVIDGSVKSRLQKLFNAKL
ncbi:MAG: hypothetical protein A3H69_02575 [Candidatus Sungbacteria bacterium RIFCSPLOWO2_02_FULL_47_9]|uniref:Uncharacterized protein n=1 Tax=Candidatus Sungbacteria bacterium RIFCSPHIGHO2_01_FULL_47_32 TaxID=1802264 RepID=A0A1G2K9I2_9BACT|nr:MAG: hypothetical protein UX72_C0004G0004 [Parcubacteria group bacterium GW2011_GWA2_47_10]OGZ95068.1 MAG: hypothetical protein A2633_03695 [Candidatus Sungbacteria bacterium RIFCSPHIGHO2_01_FULL_47_32]OHA06122.1 MAG: hypothetical protein A3A28_05810 [Candidatus Sungbacteria bacterium RIFCSPLOWO2_01_FULL_47_32]OHA10287.1 MAG: hypothetical protein A3H69_02575 [Candidatus Sungbacteria bacterium RIFCSPLOWO2_02_FULL_47_9]